MYEVLETAHAKLEEGFENAKDLDEVLWEHEKYLQYLLEYTFLVDSATPVLVTLNKLFHLVTAFEKIQEQIARFIFEDLTKGDGPLSDAFNGTVSVYAFISGHFGKCRHYLVR